MMKHHSQCPWNKADLSRTRSVCGCPPGWPKDVTSVDDLLVEQLFADLERIVGIPTLDQVCDAMLDVIDRGNRGKRMGR
jgi:hypothetical protein